MPTLLIVDDHALVREGLKKIIDQEGGFRVVAEAGSAAEALNILSTAQVDIVTLDINLPGRSGIDLLYDIRRGYPKTKVLVLSMMPEDAVAVQAIKSGASGYVTKDSSSEELMHALSRVAAGGRYIGNTLAEKLATIVAQSDAKPHERLSEREFEVFRLLALGKTVWEIADALSITSATVSTYRARVLQKMGLKTNAELIHYSIRHNIIDPL